MTSRRESDATSAEAVLVVPPGVWKARLRRLRLAAWAIFWIWFARYAYVRVTTPPAIVARGGAAPVVTANPEEQRLDRVIEEIGTHPIWKGDSWSAGRQFELTGRKPLEQVKLVHTDLVAAVTDKRLRGLLDELVTAAEAYAAAARPGQISPPRDRGYWWNSFESLAAGALILRARLDRSGGGAAAETLASLSAALEVTEYAERRWAHEQTFAWIVPATVLPLFEIGRMALEESLAPVDARRLIQQISGDGGLVVSTSLAGGVISADVDELLDRYYTSDGEGDGWLVLSAAAELPWLYPIDNRLSAHPAWNVFSPLFHSRAEIRQQASQVLETLKALDSLDIETGQQRAEQGAALRRTVLDGPFLHTSVRLNAQTYQTVADLVRRRRAIVILVALSAYKHDHREYPDRLDRLMPDYLDAVPTDNFTTAPFRYVVDAGEVRLESDAEPGSAAVEIGANSQITNWGRDLVPRRDMPFSGGRP